MSESAIFYQLATVFLFCFLLYSELYADIFYVNDASTKANSVFVLIVVFIFGICIRGPILKTDLCFSAFVLRCILQYFWFVYSMYVNRILHIVLA